MTKEYRHDSNHESAVMRRFARGAWFGDNGVSAAKIIPGPRGTWCLTTWTGNDRGALAARQSDHHSLLDALQAGTRHMAMAE